MKRFQIQKTRSFAALLCGMLMLCMVVGCKEDIDMSNRYTFTDETITSYLAKNAQYSEYYNLLQQVKISRRSQSTISQLLAARGHYTCFAPTNTAIQEYLDTLYKQNIITEASWEGFTDQAVRDSINEVIVYNSIIDGGDMTQYEISDLPNNNEEINIPNLNDRLLKVNYGSINPDSVFINGACVSLQHRDIPAINGRIHEVEQVIAPSNQTISDLLNLGSKYTFMAQLITATGYTDTLNAIRDEVYEKLYEEEAIKDLPLHPSFKQVGSLPEHRKYGFTLFAETDDVYATVLGKSIADITIEDLKNYLISKGYYATANQSNDYRDKNNIVNQFVSYHILPLRISYDQLVIHYNEKGYNFKTSPGPTIAAAEYYETLGRPRKLLKIYESAESNGIYLNRFPVLDRATYHEAAPPVGEDRGILVQATTDNSDDTENSAVNGIIYPINELLVYTDHTRSQLQKQRIRYDVASLLPELMNNKLRRLKTKYTTGATDCRAFPANYQYFDAMEILNEQTLVYYLTGLDLGWLNFQGDEFNIVGRYEILLRLPPVPQDGTYELRFGVQTSSQLRGMCQVYWGDDKNNLPAMGIPLDLRMGGTQRKTSAGTFPSIVGWEADGTDEDYNAEIDKRMRNNDFMKGPEYYSGTPGASTTVRSSADVIRRIMVRQYMEADKTYYIKFKSVLDDEKKEFYFDYLEFCAKEVYDNPNQSEDKW